MYSAPMGGTRLEHMWVDPVPSNLPIVTGLVKDISVCFQLDQILALLVPAAMEAPVRKRQEATYVCVLTDSPENIVKLVSVILINFTIPQPFFFLQNLCKTMSRNIHQTSSDRPQFLKFI